MDVAQFNAVTIILQKNALNVFEETGMLESKLINIWIWMLNFYQNKKKL